jgi:hypothetical protein
VANLIFILVTLGLLVGFLALTAYETRSGVRVYASGRTRLDAFVERVEFILAHVDLGVFLREELRHLIGRLSHDIAHTSLNAVRYFERLLTRLVRRLRVHPEVDPAPRETAREFVKVLSEFKDDMKGNRPTASQIEDMGS